MPDVAWPHTSAGSAPQQEAGKSFLKTSDVGHSHAARFNPPHGGQSSAGMWSRALLPKKESLHASSRGSKGTAAACRAGRVTARARGAVVALAGGEDLLEMGTRTKGYL